ncbi:2-dehydro-3-deoxy-D-gluconate 5-dehydrogenase [Meiothermus luteus]|jgi:2-deoxy-D-gluconate 3-dehydrogenase|uniref:2-dehydro-3-deoxy-D-gluconate 5-dehydrogenase n=1 Tax=Meiothermus luteus TaxID=2026184 RepID=A0A399EXS3_9DEIN|nr:2-dehydro-3-deoxy-D-gluconate 5-dehydrogenase KduD [Meiothermus luteus]RIH88470.1 2-dehydro-3-deoxy-D-gluconate 5-dehydrogenase [Meiothermus luteus]RMH57330.1 MAG: 2-dehydro-3-deoxy-D-gluconate 5-dehydrogenase KduD [Deinococcota bacterium]
MRPTPPTNYLTQLFSLQGRVALVTGGATGIGRAIALGLAQAGADVAVVTAHTDPKAVGEAIEGFGRRFAPIWADLNQPEAALRVVEAAEAALGPVDILVNNAGIIRRAPAEAYSPADWEAVLELNLNALWRLSQAVGVRMLARGRGKIINIASLLSFQGGIRVPAYAAAKHAVAGLTKALANEWAASGVNVNAIAPGYITTDNTQALRDDPERARQILERIPAGRWGSPEDLVGAALFLAAPASDYVHGHLLVVDGGWLAR